MALHRGSAMDKAVRNKNAGIVRSCPSFSQCENCTVRRALRRATWETTTSKVWLHEDRRICSPYHVSLITTRGMMCPVPIRREFTCFQPNDASRSADTSNFASLCIRLNRAHKLRAVRSDRL